MTQNPSQPLSCLLSHPLAHPWHRVRPRYLSGVPLITWINTGVSPGGVEIHLKDTNRQAFPQMMRSASLSLGLKRILLKRRRPPHSDRSSRPHAAAFLWVLFIMPISSFPGAPWPPCTSYRDALACRDPAQRPLLSASSSPPITRPRESPAHLLLSRPQHLVILNLKLPFPGVFPLSPNRLWILWGKSLGTFALVISVGLTQSKIPRNVSKQTRLYVLDWSYDRQLGALLEELCVRHEAHSKEWAVSWPDQWVRTSLEGIRRK